MLLSLKADSLSLLKIKKIVLKNCLTNSVKPAGIIFRWSKNAYPEFFMRTQ